MVSFLCSFLYCCQVQRGLGLSNLLRVWGKDETQLITKRFTVVRSGEKTQRRDVQERNISHKTSCMMFTWVHILPHSKLPGFVQFFFNWVLNLKYELQKHWLLVMFFLCLFAKQYPTIPCDTTLADSFAQSLPLNQFHKSQTLSFKSLGPICFLRMYKIQIKIPYAHKSCMQFDEKCLKTEIYYNLKQANCFLFYYAHFCDGKTEFSASYTSLVSHIIIIIC